MKCLGTPFQSQYLSSLISDLHFFLLEKKLQVLQITLILPYILYLSNIFSNLLYDIQDSAFELSSGSPMDHRCAEDSIESSHVVMQHFYFFCLVAHSED